MAMDLLGRALLERGDFGAAIAELERGLATPGLPLEAEVNFRYNLGLALEASGRVVEALTQFESVFEAEPNYPDVALKIRELRR
jgi:tetratricopeptide (TPR) repeat protein